LEDGSEANPLHPAAPVSATLMYVQIDGGIALCNYGDVNVWHCSGSEFVEAPRSIVGTELCNVKQAGLIQAALIKGP
jgi:hypothetical protein